MGCIGLTASNETAKARVGQNSVGSEQYLVLMMCTKKAPVKAPFLLVKKQILSIKSKKYGI
ncbi:hypothetical protein XA3_20680 [Xylocopilactobacillus apicola]|uniref:Transposase n=1 Tax=Xylocopilactobacillus apicola TaxID=2932184 RepID=A0AAU9DFB8_9LACO|nr:hypothetical protein XA3_20680 [Xylocopilactobacillus apicola]